MKSGLLRTGIVLAALLAAAGGYAWLRSGGNGQDPQYRLAKVERGPLTAVVAASGTLNAVGTVQVSSQISGQVKEIYADFNSPVKQDQIIARIDPAPYELRVKQARADLDAAQSAVAVARSGLAVQQSEVGRVKVAPLEARVRRALAAAKRRKFQLEQAQIDLERTIVRAPVDGTVILRNVDAGQTVEAGLHAPVLFTIARDLHDMQVEAALDEADVGRLRAGQQATFAVDAFPRRRFSGEIVQIRKAPVNVQNLASYTVVISARNPDLSLLPGMTANVRIVVEHRDNALKVPNAALRFRPAGAPQAKRERTVSAIGRAWVPAGGAAESVELRLGMSDGTSTELLAGPLAEGDEVIVGLAAAGKRDAGPPPKRPF